MPARRGPSRGGTSYMSLREQGGSGTIDQLQADYLAAFITHCTERDMAVYVASVNNGQSMRIRVFNGDDKYEDTLGLGEDWGPVLDSYSKALGGQQEWQVRAAAVHRRIAQAASGASEDHQVDTNTGSRPSRRSPAS